MNQPFKILNNGINNKTEEHPLALATLSKLTLPKTMKNQKIDFNDLGLTQSLLQTRDKTKGMIDGNDDILVLFPDTALAIEMIVSSMLSPNDMVTKNLLYHAPEDLEISPTMKQEIMKIIKDHMNKEYKFESKFADIIKESLFTKGAYVEIIIPEASFDDYINKPSLEGISNGQYTLDSKKYLGELDYRDISDITKMVQEHRVSSDLKDKFGLFTNKKVNNINTEFKFESYASGETRRYQLTSEEKNNNYSNKIKLPIITDKAQEIESSIRKVQSVAKAIFNSTSNNQDVYNNRAKELNLDRVFKKGLRPKAGTTIEFISDQTSASRKSIGKPLVMKVPAESVIPVHAINDPKIKVGYFIAVDHLGEPISVSKEIEDMVSQYGNTYGDGREFVSKGKNNLYTPDQKDPLFEENEKLYTHIVDEMIRRKINKGDLKDLVDIQSNLDVYRMMFYRTLRDRETKLIFLPDELVCYWAFNFRPNGTGESLLERVAPLFSIRGILLMVTILSYIKNSTTTTKVTINLDENESMPEARAEEIMNYLMQNREVQFPLGMMRMYELQDWALRSGYQFDIRSPNLPELTIESEQRTPDFKVPENELDEMFFEKILNTFGIVPEMVKQGMDPDFATTTALRNVLNNQRIKEKQKVFNELASSSIQKFIKSDPTLRDKLIVYLANNIDNLLDQYIKTHNEEEFDRESITPEIKETIIAYIMISIQENLSVTLPEPKSNEAPLLFNMIQTEFQQIKDIVDNLFSNGAFDAEENGELKDKMESIKGIITFQMMIERMEEHNLMPEAVEIFNLGDDGKTGSTLFNNYIANRDAFIQNATKLLATIKGQTKIADTALDLINNGEEESTDSGSSSSDSSDGGNSGGADDSGSGDDDYRLDDEF